MAEPLHASLTPNVANAGDTIELEFDSTDEEWKNADSVLVQIFEVDDASPFEPKPGKNKVVVRLHGTLADNTFSLAPGGGLSNNPDVPKVSGTPPIIKLTAGGTTTDIPLPDKAEEQGVFELRLQVEVKKPKAKKFTSQTTVMVRSFDHFHVNQTPRPVVAFLTGGRDDSYFAAAKEFWKLNADVVVAQKGMSLFEVLEMLDKEHEKFGDWGQINILAHGREQSLVLKMFKDSDLKEGIHTDKIGDEIDRVAQLTPPVTLPSPGGIDSDTQIVLRACNAGRDQPMIDSLHADVFGSFGTLSVPKFVQVYQFKKSGGTVTANEWFEESLTFDTPGSKAPTGSALSAGLDKAWDALSSPGKGGVKADEIALFTDNHDWVQDFPVEISGLFENDLTNPDGTPMNDAQIVAAFRKDWSPKHNLDTQSVSWNTKDDRWEIKIQSKTKQKGAEPTFFLRVTAGTATPMFEQLKGGFVYLGAATEEDTWTVTAPKVADDHVEIKLGPKPKEVQVTDRNSGEPTFVGKTKLEGGKGQTFKVPIKIRFGDAEVEVRSSKPPHDIKFVCTRHHVDRRRTLRTFDASKKHKDRSLVKPKVGNPDHYGTS